MELIIYPTTQEEQYDAMAERMNRLAEALANVHPGADVPKSKELNRAAREVVQFLKRLI